MIVLTWLAWAATAVCLITYVRMQRGHDPAVFDWANAIGCIPLVAMDYLVGATPAAVISLAFGVAGAHGRLTAWREHRKISRWVEVKTDMSTLYHPSGLRLTPSEAWRKSVQSHVDAIEELRRGM